MNTVIRCIDLEMRRTRHPKIDANAVCKSIAACYVEFEGISYFPMDFGQVGDHDIFYRFSPSGSYCAPLFLFKPSLLVFFCLILRALRLLLVK